MLHKKSCVTLLVIGLTIFGALPIAAQEAAGDNVARLLNTWLQGLLDGLAEVATPDGEASDAMDNADGRLKNGPEAIQGCYPPSGKPTCVPLGESSTGDPALGDEPEVSGHFPPGG